MMMMIQAPMKYKRNKNKDSKVVKIQFAVTPMIWVPAQLVGVYHGDAVTLTCFVEVSFNS